MASLAISAATQASNISSRVTPHTVLGTLDDIVQATTTARVNATVVRALRRRLSDMAAALVHVFEEGGLQNDAEIAGLGAFETTLAELRQALSFQDKRGYLSQILYHQQDRDRLLLLSDKLETSYKILMANMMFTIAGMATKLTSQLQTMTDGTLAQLEALSDTALTSQVRPSIPPRPHLLFGRTAELDAVVNALSGGSGGRVAILGGPGMGKTTMAVAAVHHITVRQRFDARRFFVPFDSAQGRASCLGIIASAFGIHVSERAECEKALASILGDGPVVLVLDNFESCWERPDQRADAERVLCFLDAIDSLSLVITMRGAERPPSVRWNRPFLGPLEPLDPAAARQTFSAIADTACEERETSVLLDLVANVPLAVVLLANLAQTESATTLLKRWHEVATAMLVRGQQQQDRLTSLDISISLSLHSPRMQSAPDAQALLALLALLPSGITETDLRLWHGTQSSLAVSVLRKNALIVTGPDDRISVLAPIRSFMLSHYPPSEDLATPLCGHYFQEAEVARKSVNLAVDEDLAFSFTRELGNVEFLVRFSIEHKWSSIPFALKAIVHLCGIYVHTGFGAATELLPYSLPIAQAAGFEGIYADLLFHQGLISGGVGTVSGDPQSLFSTAREIYQRVGNDEGVIDASLQLSYYLSPSDAVSEARRLCELARSRNDPRLITRCTRKLADSLERDGFPLEAAATLEAAVALLDPPLRGGERSDYLVGALHRDLGELYRKRADFDRAVDACRRALRIFERCHAAHSVALTYGYIANLLVYQGRLREAIEHVTRALAVGRAEGSLHYVRCLIILAQAQLFSGNTQAAWDALNRVAAHVPPGGLSAHVQCHILITRGILARCSGDLTSARAMIAAARTMSRDRTAAASIPARVMLEVEANCLVAHGNVEAMAGDKEAAATLAICGAVISRSLNNQAQPALDLVSLAELTTDDALAMRSLTAILPAVHRMSFARGYARALLCAALIVSRRGERDRALFQARRARELFGEHRDAWDLLRLQSILGDEMGDDGAPEH